MMLPPLKNRILQKKLYMQNNILWGLIDAIVSKKKKDSFYKQQIFYCYFVELYCYTFILWFTISSYVLSLYVDLFVHNWKYALPHVITIITFIPSRQFTNTFNNLIIRCLKTTEPNFPLTISKQTLNVAFHV